jgi:N-acyl-D-aspartate/D-glutamate deacylase
MRRFLRLVAAVACLASLFAVATAQPNAGGFDVVIRDGTILDGSGRPAYQADVAIAGDTIVAIGDLRAARAPIDLDARGSFVAPGFINIHSHASPAGLMSAVNMLTQGVTTEIVNPDGGRDAVDLAAQLEALTRQGLAVNVGAYIGFNAVWRGVLGMDDRRPSEADLAGMRRLLERGLEQGAWGISAGLDYVPGRYARTDEVISVLRDARRWRTNFPNHERVTEASGYSVRAGVSETSRGPRGSYRSSLT